MSQWRENWRRQRSAAALQPAQISYPRSNRTTGGKGNWNWWKGQLESSSEVLVLFKTTKKKLPELERCVVKVHPYDTPEFIAVSVDAGSEKYLNWIASSLEEPS
jgi:hypothetical protein